MNDTCISGVHREGDWVKVVESTRPCLVYA
jgi:hypothetical protein